MKSQKILNVVMGYDHFLVDSEGRHYDLTHHSKKSSGLYEELNKIVDKLVTISKNCPVVILSDIVTPYNHVVMIEPKWWYSFLVNLKHKTKAITVMHDRGVIVPFCNHCLKRVPPYYIKPDKWLCPHCKTPHDNTVNMLANMKSHSDYSQQNKMRLESKPLKKTVVKDPNSELPYLFSKVASDQNKIIQNTYEITTDRKSFELLRSMDRICRRIRSDIIDSMGDSKPSYKGWVDEWNDKTGKFSLYKKNNKSGIAALSVSDTIISICKSLSDNQMSKDKDEELWVVYWRNIIVDKDNKRVALPRMRGRYLQLPEEAIIPSGNYYVEISTHPDKKIYLRFVLAGNLPPKYETIDGNHHRGRNRHNTREFRLKFE